MNPKRYPRDLSGNFCQPKQIKWPNNAKIATRYLHEQDYYVCNDTNKICHGQNLWKKNESTSGEKVYTINIEDFTILLQHSISKVSVNIYIYISIRHR